MSKTHVQNTKESKQWSHDNTTYCHATLWTCFKVLACLCAPDAAEKYDMKNVPLNFAAFTANFTAAFTAVLYIKSGCQYRYHLLSNH